MMSFTEHIEQAEMLLREATEAGYRPVPVGVPAMADGGDRPGPRPDRPGQEVGEG